MFLNFLRLWTGPLPKEELFPNRKINPLFHWFIHPIKRRLAKCYLKFLKKYLGLKVIAITGSSGKTTTTNLLYSVLSQHKPTVKTKESTTTTYNLPTTILSCTPKTRYLILEMGIEYQGDMDFYTWLAKPDIAILLNISSVHSSFLGSTSQIYSEKVKLLHSLSLNGLAIINGDDPEIDYSRRSHTIKFGTRPDCQIQTVSTSLTSDLKTKVNLKIHEKPASYVLMFPGRHLAPNLAAAIGVFNFLSIPKSTVSIGLSSLSLPPHRFNLVRLKFGCLLIDDTYNANPLSTKVSLQNLADICKKTKKTAVFVFAQMNELGQYEKSAHENIGKFTKELKIKHLLTLGPATSFTIRSAGTGKYFDTTEELLVALKKFLKPNYCILIKGSNSWHLEKLIDMLENKH